jgi:hypothetical protein
MSQHTFTSPAESNNTGKPLQILCGWDRPLQYQHLTIETKCANPVDELIVYCNLQEPGGGLELEQVAERLESFGITPPEGLLAELDQDERQDMGNKYKDWDERAAAA